MAKIETKVFSHFSSNVVPDSHWVSTDVLLGAGMVVIQPSTEKIVVLFSQKERRWFLPRGRKDVGETLEEAALREAYEETGYRVKFLPLYTGSRAPYHPDAAPDAQQQPNVEPISVTTHALRPRPKRRTIIGGTGEDNGAEYLGFYYVGQIPEDAVREEGTGMASEQDYVVHLLSIDEALEKLNDWAWDQHVVDYAWALWQMTLAVTAGRKRRAAKTTLGRLSVPHTPPLTYSSFSSPGVPDSHWCSPDFILGAGMVVIQPSSGKILIVSDESDNTWFLPRGRKDVGESWQHAALREAYEKTGYQVELLPLYTGSRAPLPPNEPEDSALLPNTEPIVVSVEAWSPSDNPPLSGIAGNPDFGGEYMVSYYVGHIREDAIREQGSTGQLEELYYKARLVSVEEALLYLGTTPKIPAEVHIVKYAWHLWQLTLQMDTAKGQP